MPESIPSILLLEDSRTVQNYIRDVLRSLPIEHRLLTARKVQEAQVIVGQNEIDLFIVDIGLPDGDGLDFLWSMSSSSPGSKALVITSNTTGDYQDRARQMGVLNILSKPLQRKALLEAVARLIAPTAHEGSSGFEATIGGLSPSDIIQLKCMSSSTGALEFQRGSARGLVFFRAGEVIHAEMWQGAEHDSGPAAFRALIAWKTGNVSESEAAAPAERTIFEGWQSLLMEAAQSLDEGGGLHALSR
jgi:DNA-binding response OmpR family regulator